VIAVLLLPLTIFPLPLAPIMMTGPMRAIVLGVRMWKRRDVRIALRRTHYAFLVINALLIYYGIWMLRAAEASTARGGGLLGGLGLMPLTIGSVLAMFSAIVLWLIRGRIGVRSRISPPDTDD
jgi:hypothetical protein